MRVKLTENAKVVLEKRYLLRDAEGGIAETPEGLFRRVAGFIAEGDFRYGKSSAEVSALAETFYRLMSNLEFMPNSPTLMNAGKPGGQLSACFVLPMEDSLESIFDTLKYAALVHQSGGGTGFSFSRLRPKGDRLVYTSGITSGPISFMEVYNMATEAIKQGGTRRGANMGVLRVDHPDIGDFITLKDDLSRMTNFNISVAMTDAFMRAVESDERFELVHPRTGRVTGTLKARALMQRIIDSAWKTGEPGVLFIDRINRDNPTPALGRIEATNPCGEVPLLPYEACNLGSINLGKMLRQNNPPGKPEMDWEKFRETIGQGVHFLENVITQNNFPLEQSRKMAEGNRKIGLGLMGWADTLMMLGIRYDSPEAVTFAEEVMAFLSYHSKLKSVELAKERGRFPFFDSSVYAAGQWFSQKYSGASNRKISEAEWHSLDEEIARHGIRHATTTAVAPTGTISIIGNASGGIEPLYALVFTRNVLDNRHLFEINPLFEAALQSCGLWSEELMREICWRGGSIHGMPEIPEELQRIFVTALDIEPSWHIRMQGAFQKYSDNAVSKTINFPQSATPQQFEDVYKLAYALGAKGVTAYRNNSRQLQPMSIEPPSAAPEFNSRYCPECRKPLRFIEGCPQCLDCQYAYCG